jgi:flagellar hook-associated protein FlgK
MQQPPLSERLAKVKELWDEKHFKEISKDGSTYTAAQAIVSQHESVLERIGAISKRLDRIQDLIKKDAP